MVKENHFNIFISAAEVSADAHAARLIDELRRQIPQIRCSGLGGHAMADASCQLLDNLVDRSAMLTHAFKQVGFYFRLLRRVKQHFIENPPDLVVVVDSPAWNFHVAKAARQLNIPVLYYIAPQLWAWGAWRINKLKRSATRLACILPFEKQWFSERGLNADYVGHPLFDDEQSIDPGDLYVRENSRFPTVALLAGSRSHEIKKLWLPMQHIAQKIQQKYPDARFVSAYHSAANEKLLRQNSLPQLQIELKKTSIEAVTRHADLTFVASGTATLEVAAQHCPMIIMYHVPPLQWHLIGKWIVKTRYLSLVNILAGRELVPEFMPFYNHTAAITKTALDLLDDQPKRQQMRTDLKNLIAPITKPGCAKNVCKIINQMLPRY